MKIYSGLLFLVFMLQSCMGYTYIDKERRDIYMTYRMESERINLEREKAGLKPHHIMSYEEWMD